MFWIPNLAGLVMKAVYLPWPHMHQPMIISENSKIVGNLEKTSRFGFRLQLFRKTVQVVPTVLLSRKGEEGKRLGEIPGKGLTEEELSNFIADKSYLSKDG